MPKDVKPNPEQATTQDAQLAAENMVAGKEPVQAVDVEADYEASKQYSVSEIDRSGAGAQAAEAATAPGQKMSEPEEMTRETGSTSNPEDYREMARDVNPRTR